MAQSDKDKIQQPQIDRDATQTAVSPMIPWHYQQPWNPYQYRETQKGKWKEDLQRWLKQYGAVCSLLLYIYLAIAVGILLFMTAEISDNLLTRSAWLFIITPSVTPILSLSGGALVLYFLFISGTIIISYLFLFGKSIRKILREITFGKPERHSPMLMIGGMFFAVFFFNVVYYLTIEAGGTTPNVPDFGGQTMWEMVFGFAEASVWEEMISRVLLIGVPLLFIDLLFRRPRLQKASRYFLGGRLTLGPIEIGLVVFSALMFAFAHTGSWDLWKVPPTIIAGLFFGYIFLTIGFYGSVMFHFSFNFLTIPLEYFGAINFLWFGILELAWLAAGVIFFVYYIMQLKNFLRPKTVSQSTMFQKI